MTYPPPAPAYIGPPYHYSSGSNKPIRRIVLHGTVSPCVEGGARQTALYFKTSKAGGSAHYVVDPKEVIQSCYDGWVAWHAPPNPGSLGIELCDEVGASSAFPAPMRRWRDPAHTAMLHLAAQLVAELCLAYSIPVRFLTPAQVKAGEMGICEHSDVSEAFGQSTHWDLGLFPRRRFLRLVERKVEAIKAPKERRRSNQEAGRYTKRDRFADNAGALKRRHSLFLAPSQPARRH